MTRDANQDPTIQRAIDELRRLPEVRDDAIARVVAAAAEARVTPADQPTVVPPPREPLRWWAAVVGVAAAAAFVGAALRGAWTSRESTSAVRTVAVSPRAPAPANVHAVASSANDALPIPKQFVLRDSAARRVSVVGDFNQWNPAAARMTRSPDGLWSVTLPLLPGRHVYGFMVDDSVFRLDPDPRAARTRDPDLGVDGSVTIVGRP